MKILLGEMLHKWPHLLVSFVLILKPFKPSRYFKPFKPEFTIVIFTHYHDYKLRIAVAILDL